VAVRSRISAKHCGLAATRFIGGHVTNNKFYRSPMELVNEQLDGAAKELSSRKRAKGACPECGCDSIGCTMREGEQWSICENHHLFTSYQFARERWYKSDANTADGTWIDMQALDVGDVMEVRNRMGLFIIVREM